MSSHGLEGGTARTIATTAGRSGSEFTFGKRCCGHAPALGLHARAAAQALLVADRLFGKE
jgi:hypothetical protein